MRQPPAGPLVLLALAVFVTAVPQARAQVRRSESGPQFRFGVLQHDLNGYGGTEDGIDITVELRGAALAGTFWSAVLSPRPHIGVNLNDSGSTSSLYAGLTWMADIGNLAYASAEFGGAVHDGKLQTGDPERAELGSRLLFREALELGLRPGREWRLGLRLDHFSNANLAAQNDGITNIGVVLSLAFPRHPTPR